MIKKDFLVPKTQTPSHAFIFLIDTSFGTGFLKRELKKIGLYFGIPETCVCEEVNTLEFNYKKANYDRC